MASLLQETLFEIQCQAPAPNKDFHHLVITKNEVTLRSWKISVRAEHRKVLPKELKKTHNEFLQETMMHRPLEKIFGKDTMKYILNLCRGQFDFIVRIPDSLKIHILSFLDAQDIKQLSETCKAFQKLCSTEEFWEKMKPRTEIRVNDVKRKSSSVSVKTRTQGPVWMRRRRNTLF
ncbi:F-box only protein 36-like [Hyla sarda]|uniref:F-box only protein 36-like n=1 Tax=Hyla sarda TaxID=327740 RepID=UPI0024C29F24|nr:F-box only protein 36-like [Hyla sarda]XP_056411981.1 F-box only protein 36-like [Hyla sarda]XP_056411982.1 F-box only protein 36-like [Hyla sarda]